MLFPFLIKKNKILIINNIISIVILWYNLMNAKDAKLYTNWWIIGSKYYDVKISFYLWFVVYVVRLRDVFFVQRNAPRIHEKSTREKKHKNSESLLQHDNSLSSLTCSRVSYEETFTTRISVTAATRRRTDVWKTIIRNARCENPYNVQSRIYFRAFGSSSPPHLSPVLPSLNGSPWNSVK